MKNVAKNTVARWVVALAAAIVFIAAGPSEAKTTLDAPSLSLASATQASITLRVTAGESGAPGGFVIHWMTSAAFHASGDDWDGCCGAGFSGQANGSNYDLAPDQSVEVNIGEFLQDNGAETGCPEALLCGTEYVFRAFAQNYNGDTHWNKSDFTGNYFFSTLDCGSTGVCTRTQGYWKTHYPREEGQDGYQTALDVPWPATQLYLGNVSYDLPQLLNILNVPAGGNGLIALAHQLIPAKLNALAGAVLPPETASAIGDADALIGDLVVPPVGTDDLSPSTTSTLTEALANYNEGVVGPGHCDD